MAPEQRTGFAMREPLPWHDFVQVVRTAEQTGYEAVFVPEIAGREAFSTLAGLAPVTEAIRLGTGVVPITARQAVTTAMAAGTVQELSGGRLVLGVGAGFERSLDAVRSYVADLRGAQLAFEQGEPPPIWIAALGDRMIRLAGEIADGVLLNWCTPERVRRAREIVGESGRPVTVAVYIRACVESDQALALQTLRPQAAQYASLPHYRRQLEAMGLGPEAEAAARGDPPETLVRALCLVGAARTTTTRLEEYRAAGADLPVVYPVPALEPVSSIMGTVLALAPSPALES